MFKTSSTKHEGMTQRSRSDRNERGSTLLEFGIVVILLLTMMFGIIDFGRALYAYHFVTNAAREASRYASVRSGSNPVNCVALGGCPATTDSVNQFVQGLGTNIGLANSALISASVQLSPSSPASCIGTPSVPVQPGCVAQVTVTYPFRFIMPFLPANGQSHTLPDGTGYGYAVMMTSTSQIVVTQ